METYIDADSKLQITFEDGNTLTGYIERVEYGTYPDENDTLIILMLESHCFKASEPSIQVYFNLSEPPQYIVYLWSKYTYP